MSTNLDAALHYASAGFKIFPCAWPIFKKDKTECSCDAWRSTQKDNAGNRLAPCTSIGKHPRVHAGVYDATTDAELIRSWWRKYPLANIGLPGGPDNNLFILDVDPDHKGDKTLQALEEMHGKLPTTRRAITGSGGAHILFRHIADLGNSVGALGPGLDTRSAGGYIVVSPSLHKSGHRYEWANDADVAEAPHWLINLVLGNGADATPGRGQSGYWKRIAGGVKEGERHTMILKLSGLLLGVRRIEPLLALTLVRAFNAQYCEPPLSDADVDERFERIMKRQVANEH